MEVEWIFATVGTKIAQTFFCGIFMQNPFNLDVLGLGGYPSSKMSTFYNGVKKLFHHKLAQREKYFIDRFYVSFTFNGP